MKDKMKQTIIFTVVWFAVFVGVTIFLDVVIDGISVADINMVRLVATSAIGAIVAGIVNTLVLLALDKCKNK